MLNPRSNEQVVGGTGQDTVMEYGDLVLHVARVLPAEVLSDEEECDSQISHLIDSATNKHAKDIPPWPWAPRGPVGVGMTRTEQDTLDVEPGGKNNLEDGTGTEDQVIMPEVIEVTSSGRTLDDYLEQASLQCTADELQSMVDSSAHGGMAEKLPNFIAVKAVQRRRAEEDAVKAPRTGRRGGRRAR